MAKDFAKAFYNSKQWKGIRENILMRDQYLCRYCGNPAEEVHHIVHLTAENIGNPEVAVSEKNLVSLCRDCHCRIHDKDRAHAKKIDAEIAEEYVFDENGMIVRLTDPPPVAP